MPVEETPFTGSPSESSPAGEPLPHETVRFAHNSERQFAKLLDFYGIEWAYEPTTFTLERDDAGNPTMAFTPDFHLPAYDLYIEITTLNQKLVTKKNRKARRLREQYPGTRIKVLYQRDYLALLVKYGLEAPTQLADEIAHLGPPQPLRFDLDDDLAEEELADDHLHGARLSGDHLHGGGAATA